MATSRGHTVSVHCAGICVAAPTQERVMGASSSSKVASSLRNTVR